MVSVKRFLMLHPGEVKAKIPPEHWFSNMHEVPEKPPSGKFAYRLVIQPEKGNNKKIVITTFKEKGQVWVRYLTVGKGKTIAVKEAINKELVKDLEKHKVVAEDKEYYPVLDLKDESLSDLPIEIRTLKQKPLNGKKGAVVKVPWETFKSMTTDLLYTHDTDRLLESVAQALKGKEVKLDPFQEKILTMGVIALVKSQGAALLSLHKMSDDEREAVLDVFKKHVKLGNTARRRLFGGLRKLFKKADIDEATKNFHSLILDHGIHAKREQIRRWIERAKADR